MKILAQSEKAYNMSLEIHFSFNIKYSIAMLRSTQELRQLVPFKNEVYGIDLKDPNTFEETISHPGWTTAMHEELESIQKNQTWELVHRPEGKSTIT